MGMKNILAVKVATLEWMKKIEELPKVDLKKES